MLQCQEPANKQRRGAAAHHRGEQQACTAQAPTIQAETSQIDPSTGAAIPGKAKTQFNIIFVTSEVLPHSQPAYCRAGG